MTFTAKYSGQCGGCDDRIQPGDLVHYDDDGELLHVDCATAAPDDTYDPTQVCPSCWTIHAGDCA